MKGLARSEVMALGFMTFALFLGAGNIIFPAAAGLLSGQHLWWAAVGFLLTGVGLPLLTVVALARVGGGLQTLTRPLGRTAGTLLAIAVYLAIGPLFATPRTAVVSYEMAVGPFLEDSWWVLLLYTSGYFAVVLYLALTPGKVLERIGQLITPVLLLALVLLGMAAVFKPAGVPGAGVPPYSDEPLVRGFLDGYLTMDALGALVFGVVIAAAIRTRGVTDLSKITRHSIQAGVIAAIGLSLVYISLFYLGATSHGIAAGAENGGQVLAIYVKFAFGVPGTLLLAVVITLACLTTATGLLMACGEYFEQLWQIRYRRTVIFFVLFSWAVSNQGLTQLIKVSVPVLVGLYPLAIVLVMLSLAKNAWRNPQPVIRTSMMVTLLFGAMDALVASGLDPDWFGPLQRLPLAGQQMGWLVPVLLVLLVMTALDRRQPRTQG